MLRLSPALIIMFALVFAGPSFAQGPTVVNSAEEISKLPADTRAVAIGYLASAADIKPLANLKQLEEISIDGFEQKDEVVAAFPSVKRLHIGTCTSLTAKAFEAVGKMQTLEEFSARVGLHDAAFMKPLAKLKLKSLTLSLWHVLRTSHAGPGALEVVCSIPTLEKLYIDCGPSDRGQADLVGLAKLASLTSLELKYLSPDAATLKAMYQRSVLKSLSIGLSLDFNVDSLKEMSKCTSLETLEITSCLRIDDEALKQLEVCASLKSVRMEWCSLITKEGAARLKKALPDCRVTIEVTDPDVCLTVSGADELRVIPVSFSRISFSGMFSDVELLLGFDSLVELHLHLGYDWKNKKNSKEETNSAALAELLEKLGKKHTTLKTFSLKFSQAGDDCMKAITGFSSLESLSIGEVGRLSPKALKGLPKLEHLTTLELGGLWGEPKDLAKMIEPIGKIKTLKSLSFVGFQGLSSGFQGLSDLKGLESLSLTFHVCLDDELLEHVSKITSLTSLHVQCHEASAVTDKGVAKLETLTNATYISVHTGPDVTETAIQAVRQKLPKCKSFTLQKPR